MLRAFYFKKMISNTSLKRFTEIYLNQFGVQLTEEQAQAQSAYLLNLFKMIYGLPLLEKPDESKSGTTSN